MKAKDERGAERADQRHPERGAPPAPHHALGPRHREDWDIEDTHIETTKGAPVMLLALILVSVALAAAAQIILKHGMNQVVHRQGGHAFQLSVDSLRVVAATPAVWIGLALFALSAVVWLSVLSRAALSFAYPFAALTYVVIVLYDTFFGEPVGTLRWAGVALIVTGIILVSRTPHHS